MFRSIYRRGVVGVAASTVLALGVSALPASAATNQSGLVNVSVSNVAVPIGVAANICQVQANVLATGNFNGQPAGNCTAISTPTASGGGGGNTNQTGLVNVSVSNVFIPIGVAANVCGVQANVLATGNFNGQPAGNCSAVTTPTA